MASKEFLGRTGILLTPWRLGRVEGAATVVWTMHYGLMAFLFLNRGRVSARKAWQCLCRGWEESQAGPRAGCASTAASCQAVRLLPRWQVQRTQAECTWAEALSRECDKDRGAKMLSVTGIEENGTAAG